jgi:hypothetical protein
MRKQPLNSRAGTVQPIGDSEQLRLRRSLELLFPQTVALLTRRALHPLAKPSRVPVRVLPCRNQTHRR